MDISVLCFNIHKGRGWNIRRSTFAQLQRHLPNVPADLIFFQEVCGSHVEPLKARAINWPDSVYGKTRITHKEYYGNLILSKLPIIFSQNMDISMHRYEKRGLLHAIVRLPHHNESLHLLCVHLGLFSNTRLKQLELIVNYIKKHIPERAPIILGGDFNDWRSDATKPIIEQMYFQEAFLTSNRAYAKTFPAWAPILKLDRIYFRGLRVIEVARLTNKPWRHLSDHLGIMASLNLGNSMI